MGVSLPNKIRRNENMKQSHTNPGVLCPTFAMSVQMPGDEGVYRVSLINDTKTIHKNIVDIKIEAEVKKLLDIVESYDNSVLLVNSSATYKYLSNVLKYPKHKMITILTREYQYFGDALTSYFTLQEKCGVYDIKLPEDASESEILMLMWSELPQSSIHPKVRTLLTHLKVFMDMVIPFKSALGAYRKSLKTSNIPQENRDKVLQDYRLAISSEHRDKEIRTRIEYIVYVAKNLREYGTPYAR